MALKQQQHFRYTAHWERIYKKRSPLLSYITQRLSIVLPTYMNLFVYMCKSNDTLDILNKAFEAIHKKRKIKNCAFFNGWIVPMKYRYMYIPLFSTKKKKEHSSCRCFQMKCHYTSWAKYWLRWLVVNWNKHVAEINWHFSCLYQLSFFRQTRPFWF